MKPQPDRSIIYLEELEPLRLRDVVRLIGAEIDAHMLLQIGIAILSTLAIAMIASTGSLHRWGFVVGLVAQPLWILATWRARQWGMFALSIGYTFIYLGAIAARFF